MSRHSSASDCLIRLAAVAACCAGLAIAPAEARTLRWSSAGDVSTLDPHAQNETFNNAMNNMVYEALAQRDRNYRMVPWLATSWENVSPTKWIFRLRTDVRFHDGTPLTADDVVFSFERARQSGSTFKLYAEQAGAVRKLDDHTVEFTTPVPNPVMTETVGSTVIMSRRWCEAHGVTRPQDFKNKEESFASRNAMGTGPFRVESYEPGVKTVHRKNADWWGAKAGWYDGNVLVSEYRPIANAATRMSALRSGEIDFVLDPSVQDVPKMRGDKSLRIWEGPEIRVVMIGFDQARDELLYSSVKGRNPFKDRRVRLALYQAIDVNAIQSQVMRGLSVPTAVAVPDPAGAGIPEAMEVRHPYDPAAARRLLAEAGYPEGFGFTLHCPNDRYVNDERICMALAAMWARIGVKVEVHSMPRAPYFQKAQKRDVSAFMLGWGGGSSDAMFILKPVHHSRNAQGAGDGNYGDFRNARLDELVDRAEGEMDAAKRQALINEALQILHDEAHVIPLHRQVVAWASRAGMSVVPRRNNVLIVPWVRMP